MSTLLYCAFCSYSRHAVHACVFRIHHVVCACSDNAVSVTTAVLLLTPNSIIAHAYTHFLIVPYSAVVNVQTEELQESSRCYRLETLRTHANMWRFM